MGTVKRYDMDLEPHSGGQMNEWPEGEYVLHTDYAALEAHLTALREKLETARYLGDNHHNALACPYCNPQRIDPTAAEQRAKELEEALQGAKWELKRLEGAWWGGAITRPCQETIRIVDTALAQPRTGSQTDGA